MSLIHGDSQRAEDMIENMQEEIRKAADKKALVARKHLDACRVHINFPDSLSAGLLRC